MITEDGHSTEIELPAASAVETRDRTTAALLAGLDAASDVHAEALRPKNTTRGYAADWKAWQAFIAETNQALAGPAGRSEERRVGKECQ